MNGLTRWSRVVNRIESQRVNRVEIRGVNTVESQRVNSLPSPESSPPLSDSITVRRLFLVGREDDRDDTAGSEVASEVSCKLEQGKIMSIDRRIEAPHGIGINLSKHRRID